MCCKRYFSFYSYLKPVGELMENTINLNRQFKKKKKKKMIQFTLKDQTRD